MLLSGKKIFVASIAMSLFFFSCSNKKSEQEKRKIANSYNNPSFVLAQSKKVLGDNVKAAFKGKFDADSVIEVVAGTEIANKSEWGIRFYLMKLDDEDLDTTWSTGLLQGSFKKSLCNKIKFPSFDHELIYYNSKDFFLGSGGGEIFSYIVNLQEHRTYYAHLVAEQGKPVSVFTSDNIDVPEIRNFFILNFKRDYPKIRLVSEDIHLSY